MQVDVQFTDVRGGVEGYTRDKLEVRQGLQFGLAFLERQHESLQAVLFDMT
jgi:hypothetical protein